MFMNFGRMITNIILKSCAALFIYSHFSLFFIMTRPNDLGSRMARMVKIATI